MAELYNVAGLWLAACGWLAGCLVVKRGKHFVWKNHKLSTKSMKYEVSD
jgi:hypothetical protein